MRTLSTISTKDIIPEATKAVHRFLKNRNNNKTLPYFGSHLSIEDLVMDAVEKVIRANPMYLTKSYVWVAAKCVCIDKLQQKKFHWNYHRSQKLHQNSDLQKQK